MIQKQEVKGICSTCNTRSGCRSFNNSSKIGRMVFYCEELGDPNERKNQRPVNTFASTPCMDIKTLFSL
jgi:hypothetical protein